MFCAEPAVYYIGVPDHPLAGRWGPKKVCKRCAEEIVKNLPPELKMLLMPPTEQAECPMCDKVYTGRLARAHLATHIKSCHDTKEDE